MSRGNVGVKKRELYELIGSERDRMRDEFAIAALTGILAFPGQHFENGKPIAYSPEKLATVSYEVADAMLKARG